MKTEEKEILAENTELVNEVLATQMENVNVQELDYSLKTLNERDRAKAVSIMKELDENNYSSLDNFGKDVYNSVNTNANNVLSKVKGKDVSNLGLDLDTLLEKINSISPRDINRADPGKAFWNDFFGFARRRLMKIKNQYSSLDSQVDTIADNLELSVAELQNDNRTYEMLKKQAKETFEELNTYIAAGDAKVLELGHTIEETNKALETDETSNKLALTTQSTALVNYQTRLRKKTQDMKNLQFYLAFIQYPSIERLQSDNELVISNIRDTIQSGLPIYKANLTTILGALRTRKAIEQTKAVRDTLNKQITLAVDMVKDNAKEISKSAMETTIDTQVIMDAARKMQETHEELAATRNEAIKAFDEQSKALEEMTNKINNHLKIVGGVK
jgi:toxic anion resistance family protein